jgi:DNA-binding XRE family transcriptional regulator
MSRNIKYKLPSPAVYALKKLGNDINSARRRRRITKEIMSKRAGIVINTLTKIENGNPNTSMAAWVSVLSVLGLTDNLKDICDLKNDEMGIILEDEDLPKRIRYKKVNYE